MPFKSYKQLAYLKHNHPALYDRWMKKYGAKVKPTKNSRLSALKGK